MLKTLGNRDMFVNAGGSILSMNLKMGEKMILENYQLVAMSANADYRIAKHGGLKTSIFEVRP